MLGGVAISAAAVCYAVVNYVAHSSKGWHWPSPLWLIPFLLAIAVATFLVLLDRSKELDALQQELAASSGFPRCEIEIKKLGYVDLTPESDLVETAKRIILFDVRATNRETDKRLNLHFDVLLVWTRWPEGLRPFRSRFLVEHYVAKRKYEESVLPDTVDIGPNQTREGILKYGVSPTETYMTFDEEHGFDVEDGKAVFEADVIDYVTGESITFQVPGKWSA